VRFFDLAFHGSTLNDAQIFSDNMDLTFFGIREVIEFFNDSRCRPQQGSF
jgi:hypothetical protein